MRTRFTNSFKIHAVSKVLSRAEDISVMDIADSLDVGYSTLQKWIRKSKDQELEISPFNETYQLSKEKRPQDWSLEERLEIVIACGALDNEAISELCREKGLYPHHVKQWKVDFTSGKASATEQNKHSDTKSLRHENKALKKELNRKEKALAETAALLVLQKKVNVIWGSDEDNSQ